MENDISVVANKNHSILCSFSTKTLERLVALVYKSVCALLAHLIQISISLGNVWLLAFLSLLGTPPWISSALVVFSFPQTLPCHLTQAYGPIPTVQLPIRATLGAGPFIFED